MLAMRLEIFLYFAKDKLPQVALYRLEYMQELVNRYFQYKFFVEIFLMEIEQ